MMRTGLAVCLAIALATGGQPGRAQIFGDIEQQMQRAADEMARQLDSQVEDSRLDMLRRPQPGSIAHWYWDRPPESGRVGAFIETGETAPGASFILAVTTEQRGTSAEGIAVSAWFRPVEDPLPRTGSRLLAVEAAGDGAVWTDLRAVTIMEPPDWFVEAGEEPFRIVEWKAPFTLAPGPYQVLIRLDGPAAVLPQTGIVAGGIIRLAGPSEDTAGNETPAPPDGGMAAGRTHETADARWRMDTETGAAADMYAWIARGEAAPDATVQIGFELVPAAQPAEGVGLAVWFLNIRDQDPAQQEVLPLEPIAARGDWLPLDAVDPVTAAAPSGTRAFAGRFAVTPGRYQLVFRVVDSGGAFNGILAGPLFVADGP